MHGKWKIINPKIDGMKVDDHENGLNIEQSRCQIRFFVFLLNFPKHSFDPPPSLLRCKLDAAPGSACDRSSKFCNFSSMSCGT